MKRRIARIMLPPLSTLWRPLLPLAVALPSSVSAQSYPAGNVPPPPVTLDPGSAPATAAPVPDRPSAPAAAAPVVVVGPDGKVSTAAAAPAEPTNYYVGSDAAVPTGEPDVVRGGAVPELHVVRRGDTLWDICFLYFNDPWQWPKVWSYNPQITNPHWIYPGDLVRLLPRGMFSQTTAPTPSSPQPLSPELPAPAGQFHVKIKQLAFVEKADLEKSITIDGAVDEKVLLGDNDEVYLRYPEGKPPRVGEVYSIYRPGNVVKAHGSEIGAYVHLLGTVQVKSVAQDKRARGIILDATREIERGAKVGPLIKTFSTPPTVLPKVDAQGSVVAMLAYDQLIGQGEILFLDLGKKSGVEIGNRMFVVRRGDAHAPLMSDQTGQDDRRFPSRALGQVVIVDVGEQISIGLVTLAVQEMGIGDIVMMQAAK